MPRALAMTLVLPKKSLVELVRYLIYILSVGDNCLKRAWVWRNLPAVAEVCSHLLQVGVAHVLDGEDKTCLILVERLPDLCEETLIVLSSGLLPRLCQ